MRRLLQACWVAATLQACLVISNFLVEDKFLLHTKKKFADLLPVQSPPALCPALLKLAFPHTLPHLVKLLAARH